MAASDLTVTGTLTDALGTAYDYTRTKMWVTFNTENGRVTDDEGVIRLDAGTATVSSDGSFSLDGIPCPGASNPTSFQVMIHYDAPPRLPGPRDVKRFIGDFGWMTITEDADLADLEDEQAVPAEYMTQALAILQAQTTQATFTTVARDPDLIVSGAITRDANGAATSAPVAWPDGTTGTYTADAVSSDFPGAVDAYHITYAGDLTVTYTQPAVTRDSAGGVITAPAIVVS